VNVFGLCAGAGGLELGLTIAEPDAHVIAAIENDPHAARLLRKRNPQARILRDVVGFDGRPLLGLVDCLTAGFPCQPHSVAGKRAGTADERWIWPDIARIISECRPPVVFLENVAGLLRDAHSDPDGGAVDDEPEDAMGGFGEVLRDLAACGYVAEWLCLRASDVGPAISGTEFSSWPTPDVAMSNGVRQEDGKRCTGLNTHAEQWPTPTSRDQKNPNQPDSGNFQRKSDAAAMWATPTVPNGGRTMTPEEAAASGATAKGKRTVGLENQAMFWATPRAEDSESTGGHRGTADTLHSQTQAWPTPSARDWKDGRASQETLDRNARPLNEAATYWLTPHGMTGTDHTGKAGVGGEFSEQATRWQPSLPAPPPVSGPEFWRRIPILLRLCRQLKKQLPSPYRKVSTLFRRKLNPDFVDWLMGWPVGWSSEDRDFSEEEMASWLSRQRRLMRNCGGE
jgi:hypothetical protein